jgi:hypothetical protein
MEEKRHWRQKLWHRIESIHTAYWLWEIALAALAAWNSRRFMPHTINPTDYWFPVAVFFGTLAVLTTLVQIATWGFSKFRVWRHPPSLRITPHGGKCAAVEIQYSGLPVTWEARLRIAEVAGTRYTPKPANLDPLLRQCNFEKDGQSYRTLKFTDGDIASIVLADRRYGNYQTWVAVPNADDEYGTRVDGNTTIELNLSTKPVQKKFSIKRCFMVSRSAGDAMECTEAPCK